MAQKGVRTTARHMEWDTATNLLRKLERDGDIKMYMFIGLGLFSGMRAGDSLKTRWSDVLYKDEFELNEQKTGKHRVIRINQDLKQIIRTAYEAMQPKSDNELVFLNKYRTKAITIQYVNWKLKVIAKKYNLKIDLKTHSIRKTFGRRLWEIEPSERTLVMLNQIFGHKDIQTTRIYISIQKEEIGDFYDLLSMV